MIFVGEIRDHGTTEVAITAAGIGDLVLSTLHTVESVRLYAEQLGPGRLGTYSRSTWQ